MSSLPVFLVSFLLVFARVSAIVLLVPFIGSRDVPWHTKAGLVFFLSLLAFPMVVDSAVPASFGGLIMGTTAEVVTGCLIGFVVRLVFIAVNLAGEFMGYQLGFAIANVLDPTSSEQVSVIAQFEQFLAFLIFLVINGHYMLVAALYKSFQVVPLGRFIFSGGVAKELISASAQVFAVGLELAAPVVVTLTVTNIAMAVISKTMPQINVYFLGFPVQIGLGFIVMGVSLPVFYWVFKSAIDGMMKGIFAIITLVGGV